MLCLPGETVRITGVYDVDGLAGLLLRSTPSVATTPNEAGPNQSRKTDVADCQWLQYLHSVGFLRASHRPSQAICAVRSIWRHRESLVQMAAVHIQHMQKAPDQRNLQLHHVISDLTGSTGWAIVDAILAGERDPEMLTGGSLLVEEIEGEPLIFLPHLRKAEESIAGRIKWLAKAEPIYPLKTVLANRVVVITGGPGVGRPPSLTPSCS